MDGLDVFTQLARAFSLRRSCSISADITKEDEKTRARYGHYDPSRAKVTGAVCRAPEQLCRLVEAGVRVVTINYSFWDWHRQNFKNAKDELPIFDKAVSALVEDLHERGMADDCTVVAWGEFGRTPKLNKDAGRDHWPGVSFALLAGGGMKTGQVIVHPPPRRRSRQPARSRSKKCTRHSSQSGASTSRPHHACSTSGGRPQYLVDPGVKPIKELICG